MNDLAPALAILINHAIDAGVNPWPEFRVVPIPKPNTSGIRPIAIGPIGHKVLDRLIVDSLHAHLERCGGLSPEQSAFIPGRNGTDPIAALLSRAIDAQSQDEALLVVIADVEGAYDQVSRERLHDVLAEHWRVPSRLARAIRTAGDIHAALFESHEQRGKAVRVPVEDGLGQGRIASPLLFATYVDFIVTYCRQIPGAVVLVFADDFIFAAKNAPTLQALLHAADTAAHWLRLRFAPRKSRFVAFGRPARVKQACRDFVPHLAGCAIPRTERVTYLGVDIDASGEEDLVAPHRARVIGTLRSAMLEIKRRVRFGGFSSLGQALLAWQHACAAAEYAAPVWIAASPVEGRSSLAVAINSISDELVWTLAGAGDRETVSELSRAATVSKREGECAISIARVAAQLAVDLRVAPMWRRLRGLVARYIADRGLAPGIVPLTHRCLPVGVAENSQFVSNLRLVGDEMLRSAEVWRSRMPSIRPIGDRQLRVRPSLARAVACAVFSPYLECLGFTDLPSSSPLWRAEGVGLECQSRLLRARAGLTHNTFLARPVRPSLGCQCTDVMGSGSNGVSLCWHLIQCPAPTTGRQRDSGFASRLVVRVEEVLPPAAAQEAFRILSENPDDALGATGRMRKALDGPYYAKFTSALVKWLQDDVYGQDSSRST